MTRFLSRLWPLLVLGLFAVWFGGFTFYVSIVVPIGTEILGSARAQGQITQQVTHWLNAFCGLALLAMILDASAPWRDRAIGRRRRRVQLVASLLMAGLLVGLIWLHPQLDRLIDMEPRYRVTDRDEFYRLHRIYLWGSTLQWILGWVWMGALAWPRRESVDKPNVD